MILDPSAGLPNDLTIDVALLKESPLFDADFYRASAGLTLERDAAEHYLREGWRKGLEPGPHFEGNFLYSYFHSVGLDGPPAITYIRLKAARWPVYPTRADAEAVASLVRSSVLFDGASYATSAGCGAQHESALHYVIVGEQLGLPPSGNFDPDYYRDRYPDVAHAGLNALAHYLESGRWEKRRPVSAASRLAFPQCRLDPTLETVLIVSHQASRTGAPILAYNIALRLRRRYNVVALLLSGGDLVRDFANCCSAVVGPLSYADWHPVDAEHVVKRLLAAYRISYAIVSSIESRIVLKPLTCALVPVVTLVHEFSSYVKPRGEMGRALEWSTHIVFSTTLVAESAQAEYPNLENRTVHILPQGASALPPRVLGEAEVRALRAQIRPAGYEDALVVLCCGTVTLRKGTDLFLACAAAIAAFPPSRPVRFVWIGEGFGSERERDYSTFLSEQLTRSSLEDKVVILDELADLKPAYELADVFFLSSRLDPLPNVAIDAALRGLPIVCFERATGFAEFLEREPTTRMGVVPYLDVHAAARVIAMLADDDVTRLAIGSDTRRIAQAVFDMDGYVERLDGLGQDAIRMIRQRAKDFGTIDADSMFDMHMFLDPEHTVATRQEAIRLFLARSAALGVNRHPTANFYYRRPCPGFHPQVYAYESPGLYDVAVVNPLADFIRRGTPDGPWRHGVITPRPVKDRPAGAAGLRAGIHAHFYYPQLAMDFMQKLASNDAPCDLLLSTDHETKAALLRELTDGYARGDVMIRVVPNRGRDIGPFLTAYRDEIERRYDVVGHFHGKQSRTSEEGRLGEAWREFLWQNLIGDSYPMMDIVLAHFAADETLGLVFPDDPHLADWDNNLTLASALAARMGISDPLPPFFDFPVGTMFWARPRALAPLLRLELAWHDYPEEPLSIDGTILHALERLFPFVARYAGFRYATTHIPGLTW